MFKAKPQIFLGLVIMLTLISQSTITNGLEIGLGEEWEFLTPSVSPPDTLDYEMAYDPNLDEVLLVGGGSPNNAPEGFDQTWIYSVDDENWINATKAIGPNGGQETAIVYHPVEEAYFIYGGYDNRSVTWKFDPDLREWINLEPTNSPPGLYGHVLEYDPSRNQVLLYGGADGYSVSSEIWVYDAETNNWSLRLNDGTGPQKNAFSSFFDIPNDRLVVFAGASDIGLTFTNSMWAYHPSSNSWDEIEYGNSMPEFCCTSYAYNPETNQLLIFGGYDGGAIGNNFLYDVDRNSWFSIPMEASPSDRYDAAMQYIPSENYVLLFGGNNGGAETWKLTWDGATLDTITIFEDNEVTKTITDEGALPIWFTLPFVIVVSIRYAFRKFQRAYSL